jgi:guanosine-3',5'-bis(diphosphate) 3'-pyrophosphohydrolase
LFTTTELNRSFISKKGIYETEANVILTENPNNKPVAINTIQPKGGMQIDEEKENAELLKMYRRLLRKAKPVMKPGDSKQIKKAFMFAAHAHREQRRKSGEPYIYHPVQVAMIVTEEIGLDTTSIISAFLHDVVEDTEYTLKDIEDKFGITVANIIDGLTKMSASAKMNTSLQAENFRKMLLTISKDIRVVLIKIADRLHNMRTLESQPRDKQMKIRSETTYIYAPLAHRLGLYNIKSELEDLGLRYSDPESYFSIKKSIEESKPERNRFFRMFNRPLKMDLGKINLDFEIKMRAKSIYSIYQKMQKQEIPFEQVYDYFAIRIILKNEFANLKAEKYACWSVFSAITDHYTSNTKRLRDWISVPRDNGYESLHITVMGPTGSWVEVQVRTQRMDEIAERGYAAHWKYKEKGARKAGRGKKHDSEVGLDSWISKIRSLLEKKETNAAEFLEDFKGELYQDEVYAFTPKGDLKKLPFGASVLDFAFDIHTEVGARCMAAKVNGKLVPLSHQITNGDQVEIITSKTIKANDGWLKFVVTSRAKTKIKEYLKEDHKRVASLGKETVQRKFKHMKIPFNDQTAQKIAQFFQFKTETDFYFDVGSGIFDHTEIKRFKDHLKDTDEAKKARPETAHEFKKAIKKVHPEDDELIIGEDMSMEHSFAKCCTPIPGDPVFGFTTIGKGIKIHRTTCPNAPSMLANYGHRVIKTRWNSSKSKNKEEFEVDLLIEGVDRMGLVNDVTRVISNQMKVNIQTINISAENGIFKGRISLSVHDKDELESLLVNLRAIENVFRVTRQEDKV